MTTPLAVVILAHDRPDHLHRLIAALDPFPVFLHVDSATPELTFRRLTQGLPDRVRLLPRVRTGWASVGLVVAELLGYRAALAQTDASHIALLSGTDYPLLASEDIAQRLRTYQGMSLVSFHALPYRRWGLLRGFDRFLFPQRPWRRHRVVLPVLRPWPRDMRPAGGSQMKVLCRAHAEQIVRIVAERPDLRRYFASVWIPDETLIPSVLTSPALSPGWAEEQAPGVEPWFMDWGEQTRQSPSWLDDTHFDALAAAARRPDGPLFARKFGDDSADLLDRIDTEVRGVQ